MTNEAAGKNIVIKFLATGFFSGYIPFAPGTFGTLTGIVIFLAFAQLNHLHYIIAAILLFSLAVIVSSKAEIIFKKKDASQIVIDEITGFVITMALIKPSFYSIAIGFVLFRFFDIVKVWPASYFNKKSGGFAVVLDDVVAGIYANIFLRLYLRFIN